jgi:hypothetical protein
MQPSGSPPRKQRGACRSVISQHGQRRSRKRVDIPRDFPRKASFEERVMGAVGGGAPSPMDRKGHSQTPPQPDSVAQAFSILKPLLHFI